MNSREIKLNKYAAAEHTFIAPDYNTALVTAWKLGLPLDTVLTLVAEDYTPVRASMPEIINSVIADCK
mgnify:CR=1 FL=1